MTNAFDIPAASFMTRDKSKSAVSTQVQARLPVKPRGKEAPIKGRGPILGLNGKTTKGKPDATTKAS